MLGHRFFLAFGLAATACRMGQPSVRDILANPAAFEVTHKAVPQRGAKVEITGKVQQAFAIGDQTLTVINTE